MKNFLKRIPWYYAALWFAVGMNLFSAVEAWTKGEGEHGFLHLMVALLFGLLVFYSWLVENYQRLVADAHQYWNEALDGWKKSNELCLDLNNEVEALRGGSYTPAETTYEPYGFGKADQN